MLAYAVIHDLAPRKCVGLSTEDYGEGDLA